MRKLSRKDFEKAEALIMQKGRDLEKAVFNSTFKKGSSDAVVDELKKYQNPDGGFGHGLESDFMLPESSSTASTIAFQYLTEIDDLNAASKVILDGLKYFEDTFNKERNGWFAVPGEVNDYPHAEWWNFNLETQMTVIDFSWGNPSAEIIGYLYKYRQYVNTLDVDTLVDYAFARLLEREEFKSEHEIYCYLRLFNHLPQNKRSEIESKLMQAVRQLVVTDPVEWKNYTPQPVRFANHPDCEMFGINSEEIAINLEYLIDQIERDHGIFPSWTWGQYEEAWQIARDHWTAKLTLDHLKILANFDRLEE